MRMVCGDVERNSEEENKERVEGRRGRVRNMTEAVSRTFWNGTLARPVVVAVEVEGPFLRSDMMTCMPKLVQRDAICLPVGEVSQRRGEIQKEGRRLTDRTVPNDSRDFLSASPGSFACCVQHVRDQTAFGFPLVWLARGEIVDYVVHGDDGPSGCKILDAGVSNVMITTDLRVFGQAVSPERAHAQRQSRYCIPCSS